MQQQQYLSSRKTCDFVIFEAFSVYVWPVTASPPSRFPRGEKKTEKIVYIGRTKNNSMAKTYSWIGQVVHAMLEKICIASSSHLYALKYNIFVPKICYGFMCS